jgi:putative membrane protein
MKKIILGLLCFLLFFIPTFSINSQIKIYDNENIYVLCDVYGNVKDKILVDWIRVKGDGDYEVKDPYKELTDIRKIYGDGNVEIKENFVLIKGESKEFQDTYYRGNYIGSLPFEINVKYYLNGIEKKIEEIKGKSGTVKIVLKGESKLRIDNDLVPLLMVITTSFDSTKIKDIKLSGDSKPQVFGKKYQVSLMTILDPKDEVFIEYTQDNIEIPEIMISISPQYITFEMPDTSYFNEFSTGIDGIKKLVEFQKLYVEELKNSLAKSSQIDFTQFEKGVDDLKLLNDAIKLHGDILLKISESIEIEKLNSLKTLPLGLDQIISSLKEINNNLNSIILLIDGYIDIVQKIKLLNSDNLNISLNLKDDLKYKLIENLKFEESLINLLLNGGVLPNGVNIISLKDLKVNIQKIIDGNNLIISSIENLKNSLSSLSLLIDSNIKLKETIKTVVNGGNIDGKPLPGLYNISKILNDALDKMKNQTQNLFLQIKNSFNEIVKSLETLLKGGKIMDKDFYGMDKTINALKILNEGVNKAKSEIDKAKEEINKKKNLTKKFDSFIGKPEGSEGRVQFIVKISP